MTNETITGIKRLTDLIGGDNRWDVNITGGSISDVTLTDITINGVSTARTERVITASGGVTVTSDDYIITLNKTVPEITTITLPSSPATSRTIIVKDGANNANSFNITISGNGKNIDSASTLVLALANQAVELVYNGTKWNAIGSYGQTGTVATLAIGSGGTGATTAASARRNLGTSQDYQIVGTRTGVNGAAGFAPSAAQAGMVHRIRHNLPYGCKTLQLVYGGFKVSGAVESSQGVGGGFESVSAVVAAGGASYVVGDTIVPTVAANQFAPTLVVQAISAGAVTQLGVVAGGMFGLQPAAALAQASTSGAGTGCTVTLTVKPYVCGLHVGLEQAWNTQTAYSTSALTGVLKLTYGANFNGTNANIMCPAGDFFYTDPVIADLTAGTYIGSRLWSNGFGYIGGRTLSGNDGTPALSEYANYSTMTDYAWGAVMPTQVTAYNNSGIQPLAIMGYIDTPRPSFVFMGDSITQNVTSNFGGSLTADSFDTQGNTGWLEKSSAQQVAWTNFSSGGDRVVNYLTAAQNMRLRAIQTFRPSHVVDTLAVNDLVAGTTFANFQAQKIAFWTKLRGLGVKEIWITTCTPVTTSTDSWATVGNQTVTAANTAIQLYNTWVRTLSNVTPYGVTAVLDVCASVESSAGSGKWLVAATYDGTHPSKTITTTIVTAQTAAFAGASL